MNEERHWDRIGSNYNHEIFDVFKLNRGQKLQRYFRKYYNPKHTAIDFGCGTGKAFGFLSPHFKSVLGLDISQNLIDVAKTLGYRNTELRRCDLTRTDLRLPKVNFAFCCNVAILPRKKGNTSILTNIVKSLLPGGTLFLVVPSLESVLYTSSRMIEWYSREDVELKSIPDEELEYYRDNRSIADGVVFIDGVPTKHYLEAELRAWFQSMRITVEEIERLEYPWQTEFATPPRWMQEPFPWDWLVIARKP